MNKIYYKTKTSMGMKITITPCDRRKNISWNVGSRACLACSYCYDINRVEKFVICKKK